MVKRWPVEIFKKLKALLSWRLLIVVLVITGFVMLKPLLWPGGFGLGKDESVATRSVEFVVKDARGQITKTVETTKIDDGKTLWDWLSLLGVPLSLAILGYWLQQIQQKRAEEVAKEQRELAADETKEEVLQVYFDRLSVLLVDKNLLEIAAKVTKNDATVEERELLDSAVDVVRARTLSILRRFENDPERKTSVIRFLIEADIFSKLKLNLSGAKLNAADLTAANLTAANLRGADLSFTYLSFAKLTAADLSSANLQRADLSRAYLNNANLSFASLIKTDLHGADLHGTNLNRADLSGADLHNADLQSADIRDANLRNADLRDANFSDANLRYASLQGADLSRADLSNAKNLTAEQLKDVKLCNTILPEGVTLD